MGWVVNGLRAYRKNIMHEKVAAADKSKLIPVEAGALGPPGGLMAPVEIIPGEQ